MNPQQLNDADYAEHLRLAEVEWAARREAESRGAFRLSPPPRPVRPAETGLRFRGAQRPVR